MRTMPKSRIFSGPPSLSTIRLAGLMSRWTMPVLCAWASPEHRPSIISSLRTSGNRLAAANQLRERLAADELHGDERPAVEDAELVDRDDVGVRQAAGGAGFALEALAHLLVVEALAQELDRDGAIERGIAGEIHVAHPAALDEALDRVLADGLGQ